MHALPDRHEPDHGEVNYTYLLGLLDELGYAGWVGCEYRPIAETRAGLAWAQRWANLSFMFQEVSFLDRFAAAAAAGFTGVEFLFPYDFAPTEIVAQLNGYGLSQALFNLPPGDWAKGDRGMAALPGRASEFMADLERALEYAVATDCKRLHAMAGNLPAGADRRESTAVYVGNLRHAADRAALYGITLLIEPLNKRDNPGYFLNTTAEAMAILSEVGRDNLKLQLDLCDIVADGGPKTPP
jgi:2-dehydrotetronate isomerase